MIRSRKSHTADFIFPLILFFLMAMMAIVIILMSANVYKDITEETALNYTAHTAVSYVSQKIRRSDTNGQIYPGEINGIPALVIEQEFNGSTYCTFIYEYEETLRELFSKADVTVTPASGQIILEIKEFSVIQLDSNLLRIGCLDKNDKFAEIVVAFRSAGEERS